MVNGQLRTGGIVDQAVLAAFLETPRERFVAPAFASLAYLDRELPALGAKVQAAAAAADAGADAAGGGGESWRSCARCRGRVRLRRGALGFDGREGRGAGVGRGRRGGGSGRAQGPRPNIVVIEGPLDKGAGELGPFDLIVIEGAFQVYPDGLIALLADLGRLVGIDASSGRVASGPVREKRRGAWPEGAVRDARRPAGRFPARGELRFLTLGPAPRKRLFTPCQVSHLCDASRKNGAFRPALRSFHGVDENSRL